MDNSNLKATSVSTSLSHYPTSGHIYKGSEIRTLIVMPECLIFFVYNATLSSQDVEAV